MASAGRSGSRRALCSRRWIRFIDGEKRTRIPRGLGSHFCHGTADRAGNSLRDVRQKSRLVALTSGLGPEIARREVRRVGLEKQPVAGDLAQQLEQVPAAPLIADPAGDADVEAEVEVGLQFLFAAGKAVRNRFFYLVVLEDLGEPRMRIA